MKRPDAFFMNGKYYGYDFGNELANFTGTFLDIDTGTIFLVWIENGENSFAVVS